FGGLFRLLRAWIAEERAPWRVIRQKLRFIGITRRTHTSPKTWRWQQHAAWTAQLPARALGHVSPHPPVLASPGHRPPHPPPPPPPACPGGGPRPPRRPPPPRGAPPPPPPPRGPPGGGPPPPPPPLAAPSAAISPPSPPSPRPGCALSCLSCEPESCARE